MTSARPSTEDSTAALDIAAVLDTKGVTLALDLGGAAGDVILKNYRASLVEGGRVGVVDHLVGEVGRPGLASLMDMNMLDMTGGRERELGEFDALLGAAGLRGVKVSSAGAFAVIETESTT